MDCLSSMACPCSKYSPKAKGILTACHDWNSDAMVHFQHPTKYCFPSVKASYTGSPRGRRIGKLTQTCQPSDNSFWLGLQT